MSEVTKAIAEQALSSLVPGLSPKKESRRPSESRRTEIRDDLFDDEIPERLVRKPVSYRESSDEIPDPVYVTPPKPSSYGHITRRQEFGSEVKIEVTEHEAYLDQSSLVALTSAVVKGIADVLDGSKIVMRQAPLLALKAEMQEVLRRSLEGAFYKNGGLLPLSVEDNAPPVAEDNLKDDVIECDQCGDVSYKTSLYCESCGSMLKKRR